MRNINERNTNFFIFIFALILYLINNNFKQDINISVLGPIFKFHFNDYLAGIVLLSYVNFVLSFSKFKQADNLRSVFFYSFISSIAWEVILPVLNTKSTGDVLDAFAYFLGALTYYFIIKIKGFLRLYNIN